MPALEMMKLLLSLAAQWRTTRRGGHLTLMVIDVRKAHWNSAARRTIYIKLPEEDDEPGMCGLCHNCHQQYLYKYTYNTPIHVYVDL